MHEGTMVHGAHAERRRVWLLLSKLALALTLPAAALVGLVWRFPVPLAGYISGVQAMLMAPVAVLFYLIFGGVVAVPLLAVGIAWLMRGRIAPGATRQLFVPAAIAALLFALFMASLEYIIGPW